MRPLGGEQEIGVDVRVVSASNRPFERAIAEGRLREDLFYRLCVFPIVAPPLREHREDIPLLAVRFAAELVERTGISKPFSAKALETLSSYSWPGNVRQLRNTVHQAFVLAQHEITVDCLPASVRWLNGHALHAIESRTAPALRDALRIEVGMTMAEVEERFIQATLRRVNGDRRLAAEALGISLRTLYNRLKEWGFRELASGR